MSKSIKAIIIVAIGLIIWTILVYAGIAFLNIEANPLKWVIMAKAFMLYGILVYILLSPLLTICINEL